MVSAVRTGNCVGSIMLLNSWEAAFCSVLVRKGLSGLTYIFHSFAYYNFRFYLSLQVHMNEKRRQNCSGRLLQA